MIFETYQFLRIWLQTRVRSERAASLVEYAMLVALISCVCIGAMTYFGQGSQNSIDTSTDSIVNAN